MQKILLRKLESYLRENNPDLLILLEDEGRLQTYLQDSLSSIDELLSGLLQQNKGAIEIEQICLDEMTIHLRPSRYNYLKNILEEEFPNDYKLLYEAGILTTELINLIAICEPVFEEQKFSIENEDHLFLRYQITGAIKDYLSVGTE